MRVLLTGHKGYIGAVAVPLLRAAGHAVTGLDTDLYAGCDFGAPLETIPELRKDLRTLTCADLGGFDAVVHLAALSNDPLGNLDSQLTYVEQELCSLADKNFTPTYMRNATAYGVSPRLRLDIVLNDLVASAFTTGSILIKSDGTPWRPIVHIRDIVAAVIAVLEAPQEAVHNETFNVGRTSENYRIRELAEIVRDIVPGCRVEYAPGGGPDKRCYRVTCDKILRILPNFRPQWTARQGAQELYEAYRTFGLSLEDIRRGRYIRLAQIHRLQEAGQLDSSLRWRELRPA